MKEGDFGKIRDAVKLQAESLADNELLEKPYERHYEQAFQALRGLNSFDPNYAGELISYLSSLKEIKTTMGSERYSEFMSIFKEHERNTSDERNQGLRQISESGFEKDKMISEATSYFKRWIEKNNQQIRLDERIKALFRGEEELINNALNLLSDKIEKLMITSVNLIE